jgi:hypothetical protein
VLSLGKMEKDVVDVAKVLEMETMIFFITLSEMNQKLQGKQGKTRRTLLSCQSRLDAARLDITGTDGEMARTSRS